MASRFASNESHVTRKIVRNGRRNMKKLCIFNPGENGLDFKGLREICRPLGQLVHFEWTESTRFAYAVYNTEE